MQLSSQNFVWAIGGLCALHKVPFDAQLLIRSFVPPYDLTSLQALSLLPTSYPKDLMWMKC